MKIKVKTETEVTLTLTGAEAEMLKLIHGETSGSDITNILKDTVLTISDKEEVAHFSSQIYTKLDMEGV